MSERVDVREWLEFQWPYLMTLMGGSERINELARETAAFVRGRKIGNAETLLRLILIWAAAGRSLMDTAALAAEAGVADVSDVALVKRFSRSGDWLGALLSEMLVEREQAFPPGLRVRLLDATSITRLGKRGPDHRVHLGMDLGSNRIDSIELTNQKGTERLERFALRPGEVVIGDRGMAIAPEWPMPRNEAHSSSYGLPGRAFLSRLQMVSRSFCSTRCDRYRKPRLPSFRFTTSRPPARCWRRGS